MSDLDVVVVGAGVIGLSIAAELAHAGLRVIILARNLPTDLDSTDFCSPWAGASFAPYATNHRELEWEKTTFDYFTKLVDQDRVDFIQRIDTRYGWNQEGAYETPISAAFLPGWRALSPSECPRGTTLGVGFSSLTLNPPAYLQHLLHLLATAPKPVRIIRARLSSLSSAFSHPSLSPSGSSNASSRSRSPPLVVNATGLGSYSLQDVSDKSLYPGMGQTITVRAPSARQYLSRKDPRSADASNVSVGEQIYIIPRPASGGLVTLGGCFRPDDWCAHPDPQRAERILQEAYDLCPALAGHETWQKEGWKTIQVVSHNAGLRPCRKGGPRVQVERLDKGRTVVHAYGLASSGYQWSKGVAEEVKTLVLGELSGTVAPRL